MEAKRMTFGEQETEKLFYEDSHMREFTAVVLSCEEEKEKYKVRLDRTAFFPEGGGQFGDSGSLNDIPVIDTREKDGIVWHITESPLEAGTQVRGKLDFEERFSRMQQHSGEHIVSGIAHSLYGCDNVGFHLGAEVTTLDFNKDLKEEQVREVEIRANQAVFANLPVHILYPSKEELRTLDYRSKIEIEGQVRLVEIPGYDLCACCAPHVDRTGEIGLIKIISCERHRGGCRMTMVAGMRALLDYQVKQKNATEVSLLLSAKPDEIGKAVLHLKEQMEKVQLRLNQMQAEHLRQRLETLTDPEQNVCIFEEEMDNIAVRNFVNDAMERTTGICGAFVGNDESGYRYIIGSKTVNMREFSRKLNEAFQGKGGGKPEMVQGSLTGSREAIEKMIMEG